MVPQAAESGGPRPQPAICLQGSLASSMWLGWTGLDWAGLGPAALGSALSLKQPAPELADLPTLTPPPHSCQRR